jgi:hypothetical protein
VLDERIPLRIGSKMLKGGAFVFGQEKGWRTVQKLAIGFGKRCLGRA